MYALGQSALFLPLCHHGPGSLHRIGNIVFTAGDHLQGQAVVLIEAGQHGGAVLIAIPNACHLSQTNLAAVVPVQQGQSRKITGHIGLFGRLQLQVGGVAAQQGSQGGGGAPIDGVLHIRQGQLIGLQRTFIDFNHHHGVDPTGNGHLGNVRAFHQIRLQVIGQLLQGVPVGIPIELNPQRMFLAFRFADHRLFCIRGEGGDGIHLGFHILQQAIQIVIGLLLNGDGGSAAGGLAGDGLDTGDVFQGIFDLDGQAFLRFPGGTAVVGDRHSDLVGLHAGKGFLLQVAGTEYTQGDHQYHQQVGGYRIGGEPADDAPGGSTGRKWPMTHACHPPESAGARPCLSGNC